jgi:hypothetical protein
MIDLSKQTLHFRKAATGLAARKQLDKMADRYLAQLTFTSHGGTWTASQELLVFLRTSNDNEVIVVDDNYLPVRVNRNALLSTAEDVYSTVHTAWLAEYTEFIQNT